MYVLLKKLCFLLTVAICLQVPAYANENGGGFSLFTDQEDTQFLAPDVAFKLDLIANTNDAVEAQFTVAPKHYLYKNRIKFSSTNATIVDTELPKGELKTDANFGEQEVFHHDFSARITLKPENKKRVTIEASFQGCSEKGLCYAPIKKSFTLDLPEKALSTSSNKSTNITKSNVPLDTSTRLLKEGNIWLIIGGFFIAGLLLSLTPCVLPMIPILSSIIVGSEQAKTSSMHSFLLSVAYVLGMALSYTLAGIAAGLSGALISQSLQNSWVLGATAVIFIALAFSMFGFYELKLPQSFETTMLSWSNKFKGGAFAGVFLMGVLSALIVSPCVAAPLAGALLYIGQTHNVFLGGVGLFALAIGMGVPLLLIGASSGKILPKTGAWMNNVRNFFGVLMFGMAIWIISPVIPAALELGCWAILAIICAVYLNALEALPPHHAAIAKFWKGVGLILFAYGIALLIGALSGGKSVLQPLGHLFNQQNSNQRAENSANILHFERVKNIADLEKMLANTNGKPVMLDFYADWCVACKELESFTFSDATVQQLLKNTILLQVDVTKNTDEDLALLKRFNLFGPPGIIFFNDKGRELSSIRTVGFQNAERFANTLLQRDRCLAPNTLDKSSQIC